MGSTHLLHSDTYCHVGFLQKVTRSVYCLAVWGTGFRRGLAQARSLIVSESASMAARGAFYQPPNRQFCRGLAGRGSYPIHTPNRRLAPLYGLAGGDLQSAGRAIIGKLPCQLLIDQRFFCFLSCFARFWRSFRAFAFSLAESRLPVPCFLRERAPVGLFIMLD